mmetsp:Transcript_30536/g.62985  ORF Transcript_30536/g.62985 Transcript_30536/m.62985 type:complete len:299 (+) Transcript_30536:135-1031(+)
MALRRDSYVCELLSMARPPKTEQPRRQRSRSVESNVTMDQPENPTRALEDELIAMKLGMATAKSREDYLMLQIQRLKELSADKDREIQDLRSQLAKFQYGEIGPPGGHPSALRVPVNETRRNTYTTTEAIDDDEALRMSRMPSSIGLKYLDETTAVSALSFNSETVNDDKIVRDEEGKTDPSTSGIYYEPIRDDKHRRSGTGKMRRPPSCASGIAFMMSGNANVSTRRVDEPDDGLQPQSQERRSSRGNIAGVPRPASCASGLAFLRGSFGDTSILSVHEEVSIVGDDVDTETDMIVF